MIAVVFPGQGSQRPGMGQELAETHPEAGRVFDRVSEATGIDLRHICFNLSEDELRQTQNAQIALFTTSMAAFEAFRSHCRVEIGAFAGHSVGEYAAIAAAGFVSLEDGARLVKIRGEIMARAGNKRPGSMAAVLGLDREALDKVCSTINSGIVVVANDNCAGQLVVSGDHDAVNELVTAATAHGAKRVIPLNVSGAFHSPLMQESSVEMHNALKQISYEQGQAPVYCNVLAEPITDPRNWTELLSQQLQSAVRWRESVTKMVEDGVGVFIECGAGDVLSGLLKRISGGAVGLRVSDSATLDNTCNVIAREQKI